MADAMQSLDLRGEICPYPLFETKAAVQQLPAGGRVEILIDYPLALDNVTRWATNAGHTVVEVTEVAASEWRIVIARG